MCKYSEGLYDRLQIFSLYIPPPKVNLDVLPLFLETLGETDMNKAV